MPKLHRIDLDEVLAALPLARDFAESIEAVDEIDLLITVSGFEPRVSAVARALETGPTVLKACYLTYAANVSVNERVREELLVSLRSLTGDIEPLSADSPESEFLAGLGELIDGVARADGRTPTVVVDLSVASSRLVPRCVHALVQADVHLVVAYAQADFYYPTKVEYEEWKKDRKEDAQDTTLGLDHGASTVEFMTDFRVQQLETLPDRVVVLPAYNGARARLFLAHIDPGLLDNAPNDAVTWFVGDPLRPQDKWRFEALATANALTDRDGTVHESAVAVTTFDYIEVMRLLESVYQRNFGREKVTICAMGSKMQNLAAVLFCELHPDVRLGHAMPERYTEKPYSEGVAATWALDFGRTADLRELFATYGTAVIVDD